MQKMIMLVVFAVFMLLVIGVTDAQVSHKGGNCPLRNSVTSCMPTCVSDHQCSLNKKCCPNKCGSSSCVQPSAVNTGSDGGYKGSNRGESVYCGGVKCGPYEKCQFDRSTKREKCTRT